jgi:hypothetical protein
MPGDVAIMGEKRNAHSISVAKPEKKRPLGTPRRRWLDNIGTCTSIARQRVPA